MVLPILFRQTQVLSRIPMDPGIEGNSCILKVMVAIIVFTRHKAVTSLIAIFLSWPGPAFGPLHHGHLPATAATGSRGSCGSNRAAHTGATGGAGGGRGVGGLEGWRVGGFGCRWSQMIFGSQLEDWVDPNDPNFLCDLCRSLVHVGLLFFLRDFAAKIGRLEDTLGHQ